MKINANPVISCVDVTKVYETGVIALKDLTLTIERGMSFGLLGENGAGKSTLVRLLMGFIFFFLAWLAAALFSLSPIVRLPASFINVLSIVRIPILPLAACFQISTSGSLGWMDVWAFVVVGMYIVGLVWLAGYWLERRELLLH